MQAARKQLIINKLIEHLNRKMNTNKKQKTIRVNRLIYASTKSCSGKTRFIIEVGINKLIIKIDNWLPELDFFVVFVFLSIICYFKYYNSEAKLNKSKLLVSFEKSTEMGLVLYNVVFKNYLNIFI